MIFREMQAQSERLRASKSDSCTSSRTTKTPSHTLVRVRNNQRRHRAKVREYTANLEVRVKQLELLLEHAERQGDELREDIRRYRHREAAYQNALGSNKAIASSVLSTSATRDQGVQTSSIGNSETDDPPAQIWQFWWRGFERAERLDNVCSTDGDDIEIANDGKGICAKYSNHSIPKASLDESTTLCSEAYDTIARLNVHDVDHELIERWLYSGFRAPTGVGEGCRVLNSVLMEALSNI